MIKMIIKARRTYHESAREFLRVQNVGQLRQSIRTCLVVLAAEDDPDKVSKGGEQNLIRSNSSRQILIIINKKFRWPDWSAAVEQDWFSWPHLVLLLISPRYRIVSPENQPWMADDTFTMRPWTALSAAVWIILLSNSFVNRKWPLKKKNVQF